MQKGAYITELPATLEQPKLDTVKLTTILFFLFILATFTSYSQIVFLEVNNPFPRIGDECEINYRIVKDTLEISESLDFNERLKEMLNKDLGSGTFKFRKLLGDTGLNTFGPFIYTVNNKILKSGIVSLNFDKPLPSETTGIWFRQLSYLGQEYLVIEQRITKTDNSISGQFKKNNFIEIDQEALNSKEIVFNINYSASKSQEVEKGGKTETVSYKITLYTIQKNELFRKKIKLDKTNLKFLTNGQSSLEFTVK